MKSYSIGKLNFSAPEKNVIVSESGVDAYEICLIDEKTKENGAWLIIALVPITFTNAVPAPQRLSTLKTSYMGLTKPAEEKVYRTTLGQKISGEKQKSQIPKPIVAESYLVYVEAERTAKYPAVFIGLRRLQSFSEQKADEFFTIVTSSLKVNQ